MLSRRNLLHLTATAAAGCALRPPFVFAAPALREVRYGYAASTWGDAERQCIDDVADVGFRGIQFRANAVKDFKPEDLKQLMAAKKLTLVALSSGQISLDKPAEPQLQEHTANAKWLKAAGGEYLQILDQLTRFGRTATPEQCKQLGSLLTELGRRTADAGVPLGFHNHMGSLSEKPENLDRVMDASDPRYVKLELDTAHYAAPGGDPAHALRTYKDWLLFLHLKDYRPLPNPSANANYPFQFVELGQGVLDFKPVFATLEAIHYKGWAVVELDREPVEGRTPKESAAMSKAFLQKTFDADVSR